MNKPSKISDLRATFTSKIKAKRMAREKQAQADAKQHHLVQYPSTVAEEIQVSSMRDIAIAALEDVKGKDIIALDTTVLTDLFECIVVATGDSYRQVRALANKVREELKAKNYKILGMEGNGQGEWVLVDAGALVVHVMLPAIRDYYDLEQLWGGQKPVFKV